MFCASFFHLLLITLEEIETELGTEDENGAMAIMTRNDVDPRGGQTKPIVLDRICYLQVVPMYLVVGKYSSLLKGGKKINENLESKRGNYLEGIERK